MKRADLAVAPSEMERERSEPHQSALRYARAGLPVFPIFEPILGAGCSCHKGTDCNSPGKHPRVDRFEHIASTADSMIDSWWSKWPDANVGVAIGCANIAVIDVDPRSDGSDSFARLERELGELETMRVLTSAGGSHHYVRLPAGVTVRSRANFFGAAYPGVDVKSAGGYVVGAGSLHASGDRYQPDAGSPDLMSTAPELWLDKLTAKTLRAISPLNDSASDRIAEGSRRSALLTLAGKLRFHGCSNESIRAALSAENEKRCDPPLQSSEIDALALDVARRYEPSRDVFAAQPLGDDIVWDDLVTPPVLDPAALYGPAGECVLAVQHETEADPAALLGTLLAGIGNAAGPNYHGQVHADLHPGRLFVVIVGTTSAGKGLSLATVAPFLRAAAPGWYNDCRKNGFGSGESIISDNAGFYRAADDTTPLDKRVFLIEPEFARILTTNNRESSTTSSVLRAAWDGGRLEIRRAKDKWTTDNAHLSMLAHITPEELLMKLPSLDALNGFANRCLWVNARQTKRLPHGGTVDPTVIEKYGKLFAEAVHFGLNDGMLTSRSSKANAVWDAFYYAEPNGDGITGAISKRWASQTLRLSVVYALIDRSKHIEEQHVRAAIAFWRYCRATVDYIWRNASGDSIADRLLSELRDRYPDVMTARDIDRVFSGNAKGERLRQAREKLVQRGLVEQIRGENTAGRPSQSLRALPKGRGPK